MFRWSIFAGLVTFYKLILKGELHATVCLVTEHIDGSVIDPDALVTAGQENSISVKVLCFLNIKSLNSVLCSAVILMLCSAVILFLSSRMLRFVVLMFRL